MTKRAFNFSPGPATLPVPVLEKVRDSMLDFGGTGIGIMEISHRSKQFDEVLASAEKNLRELLSIDDSYAVLFLQGGASLQFSMVPMNLLGKGQTADYIVTGMWSEKALAEGKKLGETHVAATSKDKNHSYIPKQLQLSDAPAYVHFTSNNTIFGTQFQSEPEVGNRVLVCDASSDLLHKKISIAKYGVIYAGAQKNLGPAGVTLVIIRKSLLERTPANLPIMLDYNTYAKNNSVYNTPPVVAIFTFGEVLKWVRELGGLAEMETRNRKKAAVIYDAIDSCAAFYEGHAEKDSRSLMNITFRLKNAALDGAFVKEAATHGLVEIQGHRSVGGMRASIYNAFPLEGAVALGDFMRDFAKRNG